MNNTKWQTVRQAGVTCAICGKNDRCNVSPDGKAFKCWRDGGKVHQTEKPAKRDKGSEYVGKAHRVYASVQEAVAAAVSSTGGILAGEWSYFSDGVEVARVVRANLPDGDKSFRPVHLNKSGWRLGDPKGQWPLYREPELADADPAGVVFVTEGEKKCDAARFVGLVCVTSAHGSSSAAKTDWTPLAQFARVGILPDNDEPGRKYAGEVAGILMEQNTAADIRIVKLPGLPPAGDFVEYLEALDGKDDADIRQGVLQLFEAAPMADESQRPGPVLMSMANVSPVALQWLWPNRIPAARITLIVGRPGEGKSFVTMDAAARISTGTPWPDGTDCPLGDTILITAEDDPGDTIRPRLDEHGADVNRVHVLRMKRVVGEDGKPAEVPFTLADIVTLRQALRQVPECKLIVVDPIGSFLGAKVDAHRDNEVRSILSPIAALAEASGAAVVMVAHRRKSGGDTADDTALGSRAFTGIARAVWHITREKGNPKRRLFLAGKCNLAAEQTGLAFTIMGDPIGRVVWESGAVHIRADEAMQAEHETTGPDPVDRKKAEEWVSELLASGPVASQTVKEEAKREGMSWRTVRRAADCLGVKRYKLKCPPYPWEWSLPQDGQATWPPSPQQEQQGQQGQLGHLPILSGDSIGTAEDDGQVVQDSCVGAERDGVKR